jgi:hypothetical protein
MSNLKQCQRCHQLKDTTHYSKCKSNKDGLQYCCKSCNKETNLKFRTEINPEHHAKWQTSNWDKFMGYLKKYRCADKNGIIYAIINPDGETYIGMSEAYLKVRRIEHIKHYRQALKGKRQRLPGLHESFDKYGLDNHRFEIILQLEGIDRKQLQFMEKSFIDAIQQTGKSLNTRNW